MTAVVVAEHDHRVLDATTARLVTAAAALGGPVEVLIAGRDCAGPAADAGRIAGVSRVLLADGESLAGPLAEPLAALVAGLATGYEAVVAPASAFGKNFLPRAAALAGVEAVTDVVAVHSPSEFVRPMYAGNVLATVRTSAPVRFLTVRPLSFAPAAASAAPAPVTLVLPPPAWTHTRLVARSECSTGRPDVSGARIVVSGGRGLQSAENFALLERIAGRLGAALGATRAAVDAGFIANDFQIGQTGKVVAPELYIAVGISGAIQHVAGMQDSRIVVAINKDENAPIFDVADYGLVADLFTALPELDAELERMGLPQR